MPSRYFQVQEVICSDPISNISKHRMNCFWSLEWSALKKWLQTVTLPSVALGCVRMHSSFFTNCPLWRKGNLHNLNKLSKNLEETMGLPVRLWTKRMFAAKESSETGDSPIETLCIFRPLAGQLMVTQLVRNQISDVKPAGFRHLMRQALFNRTI